MTIRPFSTKFLRPRSVCLLGALLLLGLLPSSSAEVVLVSTNGRRVVGERILSEDAESVELEIYRGYRLRIPLKGIKRRVETDRSLAAERKELAARRAELRDDDIAGHIALAAWAREKKLGAQAMALLLELSERLPAPAPLRPAQPAAAEAKALSEANTAFLQEQVAAFFARPDGRKQALAALLGRDALPADAVAGWADRCFTEARKGPQVKAGDSTFKHQEMESPLHIELWRKTPLKDGAQDEERWPVVLTLHGGGKDSGHWRLGGPMFRSHFQKHLDKMIFVAPAVQKKVYAAWGGYPDEERQIQAILQAVHRTWKVDTNRVYLCGYSMGGYGTWHIGGHQADRFAGLVSGAGGILIGNAWGWGVVGNLMHTPIAFAHGGQDKPAPPWSDAECDRILRELAEAHPGRYRHRYRFYPKAGHSLPGSAMAESVKWIAQFTRDPYPKTLCWEPKRAFNTRFHWLTVDTPQLFTRLEAAIEDNTVRITTLNLHGGFSILLNEHLVDMSKPVKVLVNGQRVFEGRVVPTLSTILETVADRIDERQWFSARIAIR